METKFQTSFIPRKPLVPNSAAVAAPSGGSSSSVLVLLGVLALGLSVASALGVFGWEKLVARGIEEKKVTLETNRKRFGSDIEMLKQFNDRINLTKQLIENHASVSNIFTILSELTVDKVRFSSFEFQLPDNPRTDKIEVNMKGEANSFASLAYQTDVFASDASPVKESSVSELAIAEKGNVTFRFSAVIPFSEISYKEQFSPDADLQVDTVNEDGLLEETPLQENE